MSIKDTKNRILDAALDLFSEKGYEASTTKEIAERAVVNEVTLFRHFGSKENIFVQLVERETNIREDIQHLDLEPSDDMVADLTRIGTYMLKNMNKRSRSDP